MLEICKRLFFERVRISYDSKKNYRSDISDDTALNLDQIDPEKTCLLTSETPVLLGYAGVRLFFSSLIILLCMFQTIFHLNSVAYGDQTARATFSPEENEWLARHQSEIELWYNSDMPPIEFTDEKNLLTGVGVDVFNLIEKQLGISINRKWNRNWVTHQEGLKTGRCAIALSIIQTPDREKYILFTDPYIKIPLVIIGTTNSGVNLSIDKLAGKKVAFIRGSGAEEYLKRHSGGKIDVLQVKDTLEGLTKTAFGQVDFFAVNLAVTSYYISQYTITNLSIVGTTDFTYALRIGVSKEYPLLFSAIQKALAAIPESELSAIKQKWIALKMPGGLSPKTRRLLISGGLFLGLLIISLMIISTVLKRRLNEKIIRLNQAREKRAQSEARFQALFDLLPLSCAVNDMEGRFLFANKYFCEKAERDLEEIIGYTPEDLGSSVDSGNRKKIEDEIKRTGFVGNVEIEIHQDEGSTHILLSGCLIDWEDEKAILSAMTDITEIKKIEKALRESEENIRVILNSIGDAVIATDINGMVTRMNPVAQKLTGWSINEAEGMPLQDVFHIVNARTGESVENPVHKVLSSGQIVGPANHTMLLAIDGAKYQIADSGSPILNNREEIIGVVLVFRDVTGEYEMEERLRQAQKMEALGVLAGGIAHDFNNILSVMLGFTDLAKLEVENSEPIKEYLDSVYSAGLRARELVRHILTFSRKSDVKQQIISIIPIIKETLKFIRASLPANIEIHHEIKVTDDQILGDQTQFHQILMNLFTNAAHAMGENGGRIDVELEKIHVDSSYPLHTKCIKPGQYYCITISDNGCGIPPNIIERIFEPFFTTKAREDGTGMGLSTVYGIINDMGGGISVYSEVGKGTTFKVFLPEKYEKAIHENSPNPTPLSGQGKILIVDDEAPIVKATQLTLSHLGYSTTGATSSIEALEKIKGNPDYFDLVITDMNMPGMNGLDLARQIKIINPDIPIILCTGFSQGLTKDICLSAGILDMVMKPIIAGELSIAAHNALKNRKPHSYE